MRIVGLLSWFDESPHMLANAVAGFAGFCDATVAVDGAYALFPGARARSHPDQAEAILGAAETAGITLILHSPAVPFAGNEVEKRNLTLALAAPLDPEWVCVFDGDFRVAHAAEGILRGDLAETDRHVGEFSLLDSMDEPGFPTGWTTPFRGLYRWTDDLRYGPEHWRVTGTYDGERVELRDAPAVQVGSALRVLHLRGRRHPDRNEAAKFYGLVRDELGVEREPVAA